MKPHRMRMTHNLVLNYNLLEHMDVYVSLDTSSRVVSRVRSRVFPPKSVFHCSTRATSSSTSLPFQLWTKTHPLTPY